MSITLINGIHQTPDMFWFSITGGGADALAELLHTPGASGTVLGANIPYSSGAMTQFLNFTPEKSCSWSTVWKMAQTAYAHACIAAEIQNLPNDIPLWGAACTAALGTNRIRKGHDRAFICFQGKSHTYNVRIDFQSDGSQTNDPDHDYPDPESCATKRHIQEKILSNIFLATIAWAAGMGSHYLSRELDDKLQEWPFKLQFFQYDIPSCWYKLLYGETSFASFPEEIMNEMEQYQPLALMPGSFNPIHQGHRQIKAIAEEILNRPVLYEISVQNADKPPITIGEIANRVYRIAESETSQLSETIQPNSTTTSNSRVLLTRKPYFIDKLRLFPKTTFVVGTDTIKRIDDLKYYDNNLHNFYVTMAEFNVLGGRFLVFGRINSENQFETLDNISIRPELRKLCTAIPEDKFRCDISSTQCRENEYFYN